LGEEDLVEENFSQQIRQRGETVVIYSERDEVPMTNEELLSTNQGVQLVV